MCALRAPARADRPLDDAEARRALARARSLAERGRHAEALLALRIVERVYPRLADRVALEEADYRMADGADAQACRAYERAAESPQRDVAARAELGRVRCLLAIGDRRAERELEALQRSYPELPYADELASCSRRPTSCAASGGGRAPLPAPRPDQPGERARGARARSHRGPARRGRGGPRPHPHAAGGARRAPHERRLLRARPARRSSACAG
ncbi:MAG: hypothetical protein M5U28_02875 [Sandaracinaceae bacterium]|nr:hypothetical protein [Sandaracinaceae bacterium]